MKRGQAHPSPPRNGRGNSLSHYSAVVTTAFMAHIECRIPLTLLHFLSRLVVIVEYVRAAGIHVAWKASWSSGGLVLATSSCRRQVYATQTSHGESACHMYTAGPEMPRWPPELLTQRIRLKSCLTSALLPGHVARWLHSSAHYYYYYYSYCCCCKTSVNWPSLCYFLS